MFFLESCAGTWDQVKKGLTGEKTSSTDEFLVEKKDPLIKPPNFEDSSENFHESFISKGFSHKIFIIPMFNPFALRISLAFKASNLVIEIGKRIKSSSPFE